MSRRMLVLLWKSGGWLNIGGADCEDGSEDGDDGDGHDEDCIDDDLGVNDCDGEDENVNQGGNRGGDEAMMLLMGCDVMWYGGDGDDNTSNGYDSDYTKIRNYRHGNCL